VSRPEPTSIDPEPIRVILVEDYTIVGQALATMLSFEGDVEVIATTASGVDAVRLATELRPDIVIMDVGLEGLNGIEATRKISDRVPSVGVVVLTMYDDDDTVTRAIAAGARGYVPKTASREDLITAIRTVAGGEAFLHHTVTAPFLRRMAPLADRTVAEERLTDREQDVLAHLAEGMTTKQIARALVLGEETVKTHLARIYQKLGVNDRVQAVAHAIRRGLVP
jgi:NarL family two-component system response regulator LiaR